MGKAEPAPPPNEPAASGTLDEPPKRDEGKLTFQGTYGYKPAGESPPAQRGRVTLSGTLDCKNGKGSVYYRDQSQRVEWQSSRFGFNASEVCFSDRDSLQALAVRFNALISGTYSPLATDAVAEAQGDGEFAMQLAGTDAAGLPLTSAKFCFVARGGAYQSYRLPLNATKPSTEPGCTFLDTFAVKRSK